MELERKFAPLPDMGEEGEVAGYGAVFNTKDAHGDIIMPGAFSASLAKRMPKMLWQHDMADPIGVWTEAREDPRGLRIKGALTMGSQMVRDRHELLKSGAVNGLSIGYRPVNPSMKDGVRVLSEVDLYEVSFVTIGANEDALVTSVKSVEEITKRDMEAALKGMGFSQRAAKAMLAGGWDGYQALLRDAGVEVPEHDQRDVDELKQSLRNLLGEISNV